MTMIDRVALALWASLEQSRNGDFVGPYKELDGKTVIDGQFDLGVVARAAIEAMRSPTYEMVKVGYDISGIDPKGAVPLSQIWYEMFDAALREPC